MKRKIFVLTFLFFLLMSSGAFADDTCSQCKIKDAPWEPLIQFIENIENIKRNVQAEIRISWIYEKTTSSKIQRTLVKGLNTLFTWDEYFSWFEYYITFPLSQSVPYEIKRDYEIINREEEKITRTFKTITGGWYKNIIIQDPCRWVEGIVCDNLKGENASSILTQLLTSTKEVKNYFVASILWKTSNIDKKNIALVRDNFFDDMTIYYDGNTAETCSKCEWNSTQKMEEGITAITEFNKQGKKWIQTWVDAWNMMIWNQKRATKKENERIILLKELWRQWLSSENTSIIMGNLEKYNESWFFSQKNNFLTSSFSSIGRKLYEQFDDFNETILQTYNKKEGGTDTSIPTQDITKVNQAVKKSLEIKTNIESIYLNELPFANVEDTSSQQLDGEFLKVHANLIQTIKRLDEIIPISQKVCNDQGSWMWKCN